MCRYVLWDETSDRSADTSYYHLLPGQLPTLLCDAKQLTEAFRHSEASITKEDSQVLSLNIKKLV